MKCPAEAAEIRAARQPSHAGIGRTVLTGPGGVRTCLRVGPTVRVPAPFGHEFPQPAMPRATTGPGRTQPAGGSRPPRRRTDELPPLTTCPLRRRAEQCSPARCLRAALPKTLQRLPPYQPQIRGRMGAHRGHHPRRPCLLHANH